jgi:hypothetical protein
MFTLTDPLEDEIEIEGKIYPLDLAFDTVLRFFDLMDDETFFDHEKINIAFKMFIDTDDEFDFDIKYKAVKTIVETFIIRDDANESDSGNGGTSKQLYDLKQDAEYIYASFLQEYGIDLIEQQGKLRWEKFLALLGGLRDNTRFKEIVGIRAAELPRGKGMEEERKRLRKLKRIYALKKDQKTKEAELDEMFNMLAGGR